MRRVKQKTKEINCSASEEVAIYQRHFREFREKVNKKDILSRDIYNMDKTGFHIGVGGQQWIVTINIQRPYYSPLDINHDYAISIEAVSGDGVVVDLMLIIKDISHLEKWYI